MQFLVSATISAIALASFGLAAPTTGGVLGEANVEQRSPLASIDSWTVEEPDSLSKRTLGGIKVCTDFDFGGECTYYISVKNMCATSNNNQRYSLSSFLPDANTWCVLYTSQDCTTGGSDGFSNPGVSRLEGSYWGQWNDNVGAFKCWW